MLASCRIPTSVLHFGGEKMKKKNMRKNAPKAKTGYLTAKERKIVEWYESKRRETKLSNLQINIAGK